MKDENNKTQYNLITSSFSFLFDTYEMVNKNRAYSFFFRGHEIFNLNIKPSLSRIKYDLIQYERRLFDEFFRIRPDEFMNNLDSFSKLARMQHYGLKTRLLDVSENPAIALFFACNNHPEEDGEIFIVKVDNEYVLKPDVARYLTDFYLFKNSNLEKLYEDPFLKDIENKCTKEKINNIISNENVIVVAKPNLISERIQRQNGAFIISKNKLESNEPQIIDITQTIIDSQPNGLRYKIPKEYKTKIIDELDMLGINESFIYPGLEYDGRTVTQRIEREYIRKCQQNSCMG